MKNNKTAYNPFISFYAKHNISPVHQDIRDFRSHLARREKLYRLLGLAPIIFNNRAVLEVGPGGGYNALALFSWGASVDFVEPNPKAQHELPVLLRDYKIKKDRWRMFPVKIEEFKSSKKYDIVIAEGFIPGLYSRNKVIAKISNLVSTGGIAVVTCMDEISFFFELIKRLLGHKLIQKQNKKIFADKVELLSHAFSPHLESLKFASRPIEDWVADNLLSPAIYGKFFSMSECLEEFGKDFMLLGSSPSMFTDYSWYKDAGFDSRGSFLEQYSFKRHVLMLWDMPESINGKEANNNLAREIHEFRKFASKAEKDLNEKNTRDIVNRLRRIKGLANNMDLKIQAAIDRAIDLFQNADLDDFKIANAGELVTAFGRGQQYISIVKSIFSKRR